MGIIDQIKSQLTLQVALANYGLEPNSQNKVLCTVTGEKTPSLHIRGDGTFICFSCGARGDVIDFVAHQEQCDQHTAIKIACRMAGLDGKELTPQEKADIERRKADRKKQEAEANAKLADVIKANKVKASEYCRKCASQIEQTDYFTKRGLAPGTQRRFNLGYDPRSNNVVIPYNRDMTYFITRNCEEKQFWKPRAYYRRTPDGEIDYVNTAWILGKEPIWNGAVLNLKRKTIFVCESPIDAMSLAQCGFNACAVGGTNALSKFDGKAIHNRVIFAFDSDEAGTSHAKLMVEKVKPLVDSNVSFGCLTFHPPRKYKDWNEILQSDLLLPEAERYMPIQVSGMKQIVEWFEGEDNAQS